MSSARSAWERAQRRWWPTDGLRVVAALSVPLAWWVAGLPSAACLFLVLGAAMLLRALVLPVATDAACQLVFLAVAWAAVTGLYQRVGWLDLPAHGVGTAAAAVLVWRLVVVSSPGERGMPVVALLWHLLGLAAFLSLLWEVGEWAGHTYLSRAIGVGYDDTIGDLVVGTFGGALLALPIARRDDGRPGGGPA